MNVRLTTVAAVQIFVQTQLEASLVYVQLESRVVVRKFTIHWMSSVIQCNLTVFIVGYFTKSSDIIPVLVQWLGLVFFCSIEIIVIAHAFLELERTKCQQKAINYGEVVSRNSLGKLRNQWLWKRIVYNSKLINYFRLNRMGRVTSFGHISQFVGDCLGFSNYESSADGYYCYNFHEAHNSKPAVFTIDVLWCPIASFKVSRSYRQHSELKSDQ